jgi:hypothetical protein
MGAMTASVLRTMALTGALGALLLVQGCRDDEQDRVLIQEKGVYQGQPDDNLDAEQLQELRSRAAIQDY